MLQLRRRISRSPLAYWLVVVVLAVVTGAVAARVVADAGALAARYGPLQPMVTASRALGLGETVAAADLEVAHVPASMIPPGALADPRQAAGRTVLVPALAGLPLVEPNLAPGGLSGVSALLAAGSRAVAVPNVGPGLALVRGETVDVLATFDPGSLGDSEGAPTFPVAEGARVLDVGEGSATIAVSPDEAAKVAFSITTGAVTLALAPVDRGPGDRGPGDREPVQRGPVSAGPSPAGPAPLLPESPGR